MKVLLSFVIGSFPALGFAATPTMSLDIGEVGAAGSTSFADGVYTVQASGADVWSTEDEFRFVYGSFTGNGEITARVDSLAAADGWSKAGVMIRETLSANSRFAYALISRRNGAVFEYRRIPGVSAAVPEAFDRVDRAPYWVRLSRVGNLFTAYISPNGTDWMQRGSSVWIGMSASAYVGLAVTSRRDGAVATAEFSSVAIGAVSPPPTARGSAMLTWTAPTEHIDGLPLNDLVGFKLYWGTAPGFHSRQLVINNPNAKSWKVDDLPAGRWYFAVSAMSVNGFESAKSNEAYKLIL
jgi:hypothetical protein